MGTCTVIADADAVVGFRLAGVEAVAASGPAEAERVLRARIAGGDAAIVLVSQDFLDGFSESMRRLLERLGLPLVIPVPVSPGWWREERGEDYILGIIRRAIGFQMKIAQR
jgi:vacuolar-type H+-ATPase subunit F/Vma7